MERPVPARPRAWFRRSALLLVVPLTLLLGACAENAPQDTLEPEGPIARKIDGLWNAGFVIAAVIFFLVEGLLVFAVLKFRRRPGREEHVPEQVHGNTRLEVGWTLVPAVLLAALAVPTVATIMDLGDKPEGPEVLRIEVVAHQWWWEYNYGQFQGEDLGVVTANELHIPTGHDVVFDLKSVDVIHSFWVPKLAGKQDVVPGRTHQLAVHADHPGVYEGQCVEFCGLSHANMRLRLFADTPEDFDRWVADQRKEFEPAADGTEAAAGQEIFSGTCGTCHTVNGLTEGKVGPDLTHLASRSTFAGAIFDLTPGNLARWLRDPPGEKPGSKMPDLNLTEDQIRKLVAFLGTLE